MLRKNLIYVAVFTVTAAMLSAGCGHCWHRHQGMTQERLDKIEKHIAAKLDLTKDQQGKLSEIMKRFSPKMSVMKTHREKMTDVLIAQFESDKFDSTVLNSELDATEKDFSEIRKIMVQSVSDFYLILTPDQKKKAVDMMKKYRECYGK